MPHGTSGTAVPSPESARFSATKKPPLEENAPYSLAETGGFYRKWLSEDVVYIITEEEKKALENLKNDLDRDAFIEQFWAQRNPDPLSGANFFKEQHYRRIAYANDHFACRLPGWRTDRGRVYIVFGKPDKVESDPKGGLYSLPDREGGGTMNTYPFEKWRYRYSEKIRGEDIEIEFVDRSGSGEYSMAKSPEDKRAPAQDSR